MREQTLLKLFLVLAATMVLLTGCSATDSGTANPASSSGSTKTVSTKPESTKPVTGKPSAVLNADTESHWASIEIQMFQTLYNDFNTYNHQLNNPENTAKWVTDTQQATRQLEADITSLQQHRPIGNLTAKIYGYMSPALATAQKAMKQTELALKTEKIADIQKVEVYLNQAAAQLNTANRKAQVIETKLLTQSSK
ncbi:DUF3558 domain-containing protein [Sporolactobacillus vineae]|uniref:DUF3558 domain-containing protein n=1 Tax=Sporolactobacillus vineae TaxID=444463 RepID=UPI000289BD51|nr:DUF3558 domain-containing protein [Sporolactobacillus vineae]